MEVGGCGEALRSAQESLPPDLGAGMLNYLLNLGLIGVSERYANVPILCTGQAVQSVVKSPGTEGIVFVAGLNYCSSHPNWSK